MSLTIRPSATPQNSRTAKLLKGWSFCQHELLYLSWAVMDVAILTPLALALMGWARYWPPGLFMLWMLLVMLLAFNLGRLMSSLQIPVTRQQTVMAVTLLLVVFFSLRTLLHMPDSLLDFGWIGQFFTNLSERGNLLWLRDFLLFGTVIVCWVRGIKLIERNFTVNRLGLRLRVGGLLLMPVILWIANRQLLWDPSLFVLLFFLAGLTAVALIRAEELEKELSGNSAALTPRWLIMVLLASVSTIFAAGVVALIVSGQAATSVLGFLAPIWLGIEFTVSVALTTLLFLLFPFLQLFDFTIVFRDWFWEQLLIFAKIASKLSRYAREPVEFQPQQLTSFTPFDDSIILDGLDEVGIDLSQNAQVIVVLLAVAVVLIVALVLGQMYRQTAVTARNRSTIYGHHDDEQEDGRLKSLLNRFGFLRNWQTAVSIRHIYRSMLRAADAAGYPRLDAETPYEYLNTLGKAWPTQRPETELITNAYVKIRYGELPETEEELNAIKQAWQTLKHTRPIDSFEGAS